MPIGFKGRLVKLSIDRERWLEEHRRRARQLLREAAREFVLAAYVQVPVWSGMSRGAFKFAKGRSGPSAGIFLSVYVKVLVPIGPNRTWDGEPLDTSRPKKNPEQGGREARYTFSDSNNQFAFTFNAGSSYFEYNDQGPEGLRPSFSRPWKSFDAGRAAFKLYIQNNAKTIIPDLRDGFVVRDPIKLGDGTTI